MSRSDLPDLLAWAVAFSVAVVGVLMLVGVLARAVDPQLRMAFGGVLVLYGIYRAAVQLARRNRTHDDA